MALFLLTDTKEMLRYLKNKSGGDLSMSEPKHQWILVGIEDMARGIEKYFCRKCGRIENSKKMPSEDGCTAKTDKLLFDFVSR
ncbi:MAG: hypothetical protein AAB495_00730 [Patescibacteria group bacterium]